jgi:hypothetical protein
MASAALIEDYEQVVPRVPWIPTVEKAHNPFSINTPGSRLRGIPHDDDERAGHSETKQSLLM